jgi:hypothetical protein
MNRDIRSFFGGAPTNSGKDAEPMEKKTKKGAKASKKRTVLTDEAGRSVTPPRKRPRTAKVQEKVPLIGLVSDIDSDPEEPLPSKYRKRKKPQRIISSGNYAF